MSHGSISSTIIVDQALLYIESDTFRTINYEILLYTRYVDDILLLINILYIFSIVITLNWSRKTTWSGEHFNYLSDTPKILKICYH